VVDAADPASAVPTTSVGAVHSRADAERLAAVHGCWVAADGTGGRRVVAAPEPQRVVEEGVVRLLVEAGALVVCGGVPVQDRLGRSTGVEAVVDEGLTAGRIAVAMGADWLLLLTDAAAVVRDPGTPQATVLQVLPVADVAGLHLPPGSTGPEVRAGARFTETTGHPSSIGALADAAAVLAGTAGTTIIPSPPGGVWSGAPAAA
jgi:carbamate kinase